MVALRRLFDEFGGGERGGSLVEMALVILLLFMAMTGAVDIGRAFNHYTIITNAAREGARTASRTPCKDDNRPQLRNAIVSAVLREATESGIALTGDDVTILPDPVANGCAAAGAPIVVRVDFQMTTIMGGILGYGEIPLQSEVQMVFFGSD